MEEVLFRQRIGELIRRHRKQHLMTQADLAEEAGMEEKHIGRIERGEHGISFDTFGKLVLVFDIDFGFRELF